jgi:AcrR family transcriptional regulator
VARWRESRIDSDAMTGRRGTLNVERWEAVLRAAGEEFYEKGFRGARLRDIAARVGLLTGSLYYYIDSKEDLLFAIVDSACRRGVASIIEDPATASSDAPTRLQAFVTRQMMLIESEPWASARVVAGDLPFLSPEHQTQVHSMRRQMNAFVRGIIDKGIAEGHFAAGTDPGVATNMVFDLVYTTGNREFARAERMISVGEWYARVLIRGLAPDAVVATHQQVAHDIELTRDSVALESDSESSPNGETQAPHEATRRATNERRRQEIVDAAAAEFHDVGYEAARLQDISRRVGLLAGSLYHYIDSKEELLYELIRETHEKGVARVMACDQPHLNACDRLRRFVVAWGEYAHSTRFTVVERDMRALSAGHRAEITTQRQAVHSLVREIFETGISQGVIDDTLSPDVVANSLLSTLAGIRAWYRPSGRMTRRSIYEWYGNLFIQATAPIHAER